MKKKYKLNYLCIIFLTFLAGCSKESAQSSGENIESQNTDIIIDTNFGNERPNIEEPIRNEAGIISALIEKYKLTENYCPAVTLEDFDSPTEVGYIRIFEFYLESEQNIDAALNQCKSCVSNNYDAFLADGANYESIPLSDRMPDGRSTRSVLIQENIDFAEKYFREETNICEDVYSRYQ